MLQGRYFRNTLIYFNPPDFPGKGLEPEKTEWLHRGLTVFQNCLTCEQPCGSRQGFHSSWKSQNQTFRLLVQCSFYNVCVCVCVCLCVCVCELLGRVRLFATPWTAALLAPLSTEFSRQEYWSGLPCPSPGDLSHSRQTLYCLNHQGRSFYNATCQNLKLWTMTTNSQSHRKMRISTRNKETHRLRKPACPHTESPGS